MEAANRLPHPTSGTTRVAGIVSIGIAVMVVVIIIVVVMIVVGFESSRYPERIALVLVVVEELGNVGVDDRGMALVVLVLVLSRLLDEMLMRERSRE